MPGLSRRILSHFLGRYAARLRMPRLLLVLAVLFLLNLAIPDPIPWIDEIMLGIATLIVGSLKRSQEEAEKPATKDVTPRVERPHDAA